MKSVLDRLLALYQSISGTQTEQNRPIVAQKTASQLLESDKKQSNESVKKRQNKLM